MGLLELGIGIYFLSVLIFTYLLLFSATRQINTGEKEPSLPTPTSWPTLTVLVPAYNEEAVIATTIVQLLKLQHDYRETYGGRLQICIANDGSTDNTLTEITAGFGLYSTSKHLWINPTLDIILVDRPENGGRAAALNSALAHAKGEYIISTDADTLIEFTGLMRIVRYMEYDKELEAMGGTILLSNTPNTDDDVEGAFRVGSSPLVSTQIVEYIRAFIYGRMGLNLLGENLIVSGAFGVFRASTLQALEGWDENALAEDLDVVVRIRNDRGGKIKFIPEPVAWTQAPQDFKSLANQRDRWYRGLTQAMNKWKGLFVKKPSTLKSKALVYATMPIYIWTEWLAPLVQTFGIGLIIYHSITNAFNWPMVIGVALFAYLLTVGTSLWALALERRYFRRYAGKGDFTKLFGVALIEPFWYNPLHVYWRMRGLFKYIFLKDRSWGTMKRFVFVLLSLALGVTPLKAQYVETSALAEAHDGSDRFDLALRTVNAPIFFEYRQTKHNESWDDQLRVGAFKNVHPDVLVHGSVAHSLIDDVRLLPTWDLTAGVDYVRGRYVLQPSVRRLTYRVGRRNEHLTELRGILSTYFSDMRADALLGVASGEAWWYGARLHKDFEGGYGVEGYLYGGEEIVDFPVQIADSRSLGMNLSYIFTERVKMNMGIGHGVRNDNSYLIFNTALRIQL